MEDHTSEGIAYQALQRPIEYTIKLTKEVFILNKPLFLSVAAIVILFSMLANIPLVGILFSILSGVLLFMLFFFVGKLFERAKTMDAFVDEIRSTTLSTLWRDYYTPSLGAYFGWLTLILSFLLLFAMMIMANGETEDILIGLKANDYSGLIAILPSMIVPSIIVMALVTYLMPLVFAKMIAADTFGEAYRAVFTFFRGDVWKRAFTGAYFKYMSLLGVILIVFVIAMMIISGIVMWLLAAIDPSMVLIATVVALIFTVTIQVVMNIFYAISAIIADKMTEYEWDE